LYLPEPEIREICLFCKQEEVLSLSLLSVFYPFYPALFLLFKNANSPRGGKISFFGARLNSNYYLWKKLGQ
jgi:hypothetical protein